MFKKADWIWINKEGSPDEYGEFYSKFRTQGGAKIKISCDGDYTLFINGKYVSSNQYGDFEHYKSVDEIDISSFVTAGENHMAILVWYFGQDSQRYRKYAPGVIFEITENGSVLLASDENILSRKSKAYTSGKRQLISSQLGFSYEYKFPMEDSWTVGMGDSFTKSVKVNKECSFVPRPNKRLCLGKAIYANQISQEPLVFDLGKEYVGLLTVSIECDEETKVEISYGECLINGKVKKNIHDRRFCVDYLLSAGENNHTSPMLRFACRYLQVESDKPITVKKIGLIPQYYPVKEKENNQKGIDKEIYNACLNTLKLCMMEHYVDCPWREQCLYAFDSRNQMLSGYYAFEDGNFDYVKSNLVLMSKDRRNDNLMSICYPCGSDLTIPSFSLYYILAVKEYIIHSGDCSIINQVGTKIEEILKVFLENENGGVICKFSGECHWNFYDWSEHASGQLFHSEASTPDATISILTVMALQSYKEICSLCHNDNSSFAYDHKIAILKEKIKDTFFDKERGLFLTDKDGVPTTLVNSLAVFADIVSKEEAKIICEHLANGTLIPCSLSMKCFTYDALLKTDKDAYRHTVLDSIRSDYAPMLSTGTVWETVCGESDFGGAGSLCHGWSSTPIYYYNILLD